MGKGFIVAVVLLGAGLALVLSIACSDSAVGLRGTAEDLWGNKIDLGRFGSGNTIIVPFSASNCGYCLIDGELIRRNYLDPNKGSGGTNFYMSLFNPQADNYAFLKHYREADQTLLTYPTELQAYQKDGFPYLIYFRAGEMLFRGGSSPYDDLFDSLRTALKLSDPAEFQVPGTYKLVDNLTSETKRPNSVLVLPDTLREMLADIKKRIEASPGWHVKQESELDTADLKSHVEYNSGRATAFRFSALAGRNTPITFDPDSIGIGRYRFARSEIGMHAFFPNPYDSKRTVAFKLPDPAKGFVYQPWTDFVIWRHDSATNAPQVLMDGFFEKGPDNIWKFADSLTTTYVDLKDHCAGGICPLPAVTRLSSGKNYTPTFSDWSESPFGRTRTLGSKSCRFPSITAGKGGEVGLVWEEDGDVIAATLSADREPSVLGDPEDVPDSYNPRIAWDGSSYAVAYLSNPGRLYRCYLRYIDGDRLSEPVPVSPLASFDAMMPAIASDGKGSLAIAWTEWKANQRFPRFRLIKDRTLEGMQDIKTVDTMTNGYVNAWSIALDYDRAGKLSGIWQQHYPSMLGVCGGDLTTRASSVTRLGSTINECEVGGYPSTVADKDGRRWIFWQSDAFATHAGTPQKIVGSVGPVEFSSWSTPYTLSLESQSFLNETPRTALDSTGNVWVVWSGRPKGDDTKWGIYACRQTGSAWSAPKLISDSKETGRAPDVCVSSDGGLWVTWHAGEGEKMKIRLLKLDPKAI